MGVCTRTALCVLHAVTQAADRPHISLMMEGFMLIPLVANSSRPVDLLPCRIAPCFQSSFGQRVGRLTYSNVPTCRIGQSEETHIVEPGS